MSTSKTQKPRRQYSLEDLKIAVEAVKSKKMTLGKASSLYHVPKSTLLVVSRNEKPLGESFMRYGPEPLLGWQNEDFIVRTVSERIDRGESVSFHDVKDLAAQIIENDPSLKKRCRFAKGDSNTPNKAWCRLFLMRHPEFTEKLGLPLPKPHKVTKRPKTKKSPLLVEKRDTAPVKRCKVKASSTVTSQPSAGGAGQTEEDANISIMPMQFCDTQLEEFDVHEDVEIIPMDPMAPLHSDFTEGSSFRNIVVSELHEASISANTTPTWPATPINMILRRPCWGFTGRDTEENFLLDALNDRSTASLAITGPAGVGKTELLLHVLSTRELPFQHVLWVSADSSASVRTSFQAIAQLLRLPEEQHLHVLISNVVTACRNRRSLIIYDDVPNWESLMEHLPTDMGQLTYLVTSRFIDCKTSFILPLNCFPMAVATEYLTSNIEGVSHNEARQIAEFLSCLPLALALAIAYIKLQVELSEFGVPFNTWTFISNLANSDEDFFKFSPCKVVRSGYCKSLVEIFESTRVLIEKEENCETALQVLNMIASRATPISDVSSISLYPEHTDRLVIPKACLLLKKYSLIEKTDSGVTMKSIFKSILQIRPLCDLQ